MTLISITAPSSGPIATRQVDVVIPGTEVAFGGFSTLFGSVSTDISEDTKDVKGDIYLLGMTDGGLQLARVGLNDIGTYAKFTFFDPENLNFTTDSPSSGGSDRRKVYLPGTFSSGSVFYSPYFSTFVMIYFNKLADSTFYIRFLNTGLPLGNDAVWRRGGKHGKGIEAEDAEALTKYAWSLQQKLYVTPTGKGGFNYAGVAHPEYFNRQYFGKSLYPDGTPAEQRKNDWYGSKLIAESDAGGDGKHVLLSWTSQSHGGLDTGIYTVQIAVIEFDDIPARPGASTSTMTTFASTMPPRSATTHKPTDKNMGPNGKGKPWGSEMLPMVEKVFVQLILVAAGALFL